MVKLEVPAQDVAVAPAGLLPDVLGAVTVSEPGGGFSYFFSTSDPREMELLPDHQTHSITSLGKINHLPQINAFLATINRKLPVGGYYTGCVETAEQLKRRILSAYPRWIAWPYYLQLFLVKRVGPKLKATRFLCCTLTKGQSHVLTKAEVLGRLVYSGFDIVDYQEVGDEFYFVVQKIGAVRREPAPSGGPLFKTKRVGRAGQAFYFYKLRTMHPYSEYLQECLFVREGLMPNGKFKNDFRISTWGRLLRKIWLDELPMLFNLLKGDLKLVGVRPLSAHYLSLYPKELVAKRLRYRPGLLPPFYADLPKNIEEIFASEERYLQAYEQHPIKTDAQYLFRILYNILCKRARSQ